MQSHMAGDTAKLCHGLSLKDKTTFNLCCSSSSSNMNRPRVRAPCLARRPSENHQQSQPDCAVMWTGTQTGLPLVVQPACDPVVAAGGCSAQIRTGPWWSGWDPARGSQEGSRQSWTLSSLRHHVSHASASGRRCAAHDDRSDRHHRWNCFQHRDILVVFISSAKNRKKISPVLNSPVSNGVYQTVWCSTIPDTKTT